MSEDPEEDEKKEEKEGEEEVKRRDSNISKGSDESSQSSNEEKPAEPDPHSPTAIQAAAQNAAKGFEAGQGLFPPGQSFTSKPTESTLHILSVHHKPNFQADLDSNSILKLLPSILLQTQFQG
jgi:hypothetical protein